MNDLTNERKFIKSLNYLSRIYVQK